jgi:hypothetical protein
MMMIMMLLLLLKMMMKTTPIGSGCGAWPDLNGDLDLLLGGLGPVLNVRQVPLDPTLRRMMMMMMLSR